MPDTFDEQAEIAGEAAGLRPDQWPGLAHIFRSIAKTEREACAALIRRLSATTTDDVNPPFRARPMTADDYANAILNRSKE